MIAFMIAFNKSSKLNPSAPSFTPYTTMQSIAKTDEISYVIKEYLRFSQHPFITRYKIPTGKLSPLKQNTSYQITVYTSRNNIDSPEIKAIQIINNYKPLPPNNIQQIYDKDNDEIILRWQLPKYTYGDIFMCTFNCSGIYLFNYIHIYTYIILQLIPFVYIYQRIDSYNI